MPFSVLHHRGHLLTDIRFRFVIPKLPAPNGFAANALHWLKQGMRVACWKFAFPLAPLTYLDFGGWAFGSVVESNDVNNAGGS